MVVVSVVNMSCDMDVAGLLVSSEDELSSDIVGEGDQEFVRERVD